VANQVCDLCGVMDALLHAILSKDSGKIHVCATCANNSPAFQQMISLNPIKAVVLGTLPAPGEQPQPVAPNKKVLTMRDFLNPVSEGQPKTVPKRSAETKPAERAFKPARSMSAEEREKESKGLKAELAKLISQERYEECSLLKARIGELEKNTKKTPKGEKK
jgi:protein-arginine kinase activator protein McsA